MKHIKLAMKVFIAVLVFFFSLQSWTKADDISDFEIDGMSVKDSLLKFYSLPEIKSEVNNATFYPKSKKMMVVGFDSSNPEDQYKRHEFHIKKNDMKYTIYSIKGLIPTQINYCLDQKKIIVSEIQNQVSDTKKKDYKSDYGNSYGNSIAHVTDFDFKNGSSIRVWCSEWDQSNENVKDSLYEDSLTVNLSSKEQIDFVNKEAY